MADAFPSGYRFSTVTPNDHSGLIYIAAFLTFTYSNLTFITRCFIKWQVFGYDDLATCVAQVASTVQFAILLVALSAGLGRSFEMLSDGSYERVASLQYGYQIALYLSLGLSKCAAVTLVQRLFTRDAKQFWMICNIVVAVMAIWTIFAALMLSVGCSPEGLAPGTESQICPGISTRYKVVIITDALTDALLVLAPAYLVCQLQMSVSLKLQVISVFAFRLPLIPLSALAFSKFDISLHSSNPGVDRTPAIVYQQIQLCFSLIAGTVPCLKSFIRSFDTGSGVKAGYASHYGSSGPGESYKMHSLSTGSALRSQNDDHGEVRVNNRAFQNSSHSHGRPRGNSVAKVTTGAYSTRPANKEEDAASHDSQELFIRRDVQWEVRSENVR
ncbi:hypothetical protein EJ04DRAFT_469290 [Polyplosphaeria fusca]|uniref:Rhodopsin domain-containing protein n=1 Tax=Polyplosphaeria fusca TaxID=682080 RepID=A0A9P4QWS5_9PLEO|nr:hypothetical protein EJ04DRAFT_469290 [Polyplosphaeria fusca]